MSDHPFEIDGDNVERLRDGFGAFVRRLLEAEAASQGMPGHNVLITARENDPDGGVDATLVDAPGSRWVPAGTSAWQFKRSDITPGKLREEVNKPEVIAIVNGGGSYCFVVGSDLTPRKTRNRQEAMETEIGDSSKVRLYQASQLASWANEYPAVLAALGRFGSFTTHGEWGRTRGLETTWVPSPDLEQSLEAIRSQIVSGNEPMRVEGPSGIGKTRLVLEALAREDLAPLVAYLVAESDIEAAYLNSFIRNDHDVILVVDECSSETHRLLEKRLRADGHVRLVTIGQAGELDSFRAGVIRPSELDDATLNEVISANYSSLSDQRRRYVVDVAGGVVGFALQLASAIAPLDEADAAELMRRTKIPTIVEFLAGDLPLELIRSLALFRRIGWEGEKASQLNALAAWLDVDPASLREAANRLEDYGLLTREGRYRAVAPFPVAVSLAADAWERDAKRITAELLPALDAEAQTAVLARAADLGRFPAAAESLEGLLAPGGPFGSIDGIEGRSDAEMLSYLAVIAPSRAARHLSTIIDAASLDTLQAAVRSRRSLVWALEKLAWHPETFAPAADALLRLSLAENETWSNNATGIWVDLFGARLPSTAAMPEARLTYLEDRSQSPDIEVRKRVVDAADRGIQPREFRSVSAELQQGVAVREPGFTRDQTADRQYREGMLAIIKALADDESAGVSEQAVSHLAALGLQLAGTQLWAAYLDAAGRLTQDQQALLRREAQQWLRETEQAEKREGAEDVRELIEVLDVVDPMARLKDLGATPGWLIEKDEVIEQSLLLLTALWESDRAEEVWDWLSAEEVPGAYFIGRALAVLPNTDNEGLARTLVSVADRNLHAVAGFLDGAELADRLDRDDFLDSRIATGLTAEQRARLSMVPEPSRRSLQRVKELVLDGELPVVFSSTLGLGGWSRNYESDEFREILDYWIEAAQTDDDIATLTVLLALHLHRQEEVQASLAASAWAILEQRRRHDTTGAAAWNWSEIAKRVVQQDPARMADLILSMIASGLVLLSSSSEAEVLSQAAQMGPNEVWDMLTQFLRGDRGYLVAMTVRGWLLQNIPVETVTSWIGSDAERAELVAEVAPVGRSEPGELARWLLVNFGQKDAVRTSLKARFYEGSWTGPMSQWISGLIADLEGWSDEPAEVKQWAEELIGHLRADQLRARLEEEERGF